MIAPLVLLLPFLAAGAGVETRSPYELLRYDRHGYSIDSVGISPDGRVVTSGADEAIVWSLADGETLGEQPLDFSEMSRSAISPDGKVVVTVDDSKHMLLWLLHHPSVGIDRVDDQKSITHVTFAPDGSYHVTAASDGSIVLWDSSQLYRDRGINVVDGDKKRSLQAAGAVAAIEFSHDSKRLGAISKNDEKLQFELWEAATGKRLRQFEVDSTALAFSPDGSRLVAGSTIWDLKTFQTIARLDALHPLYVAKFPATGGWLVTGGHDNCLTFWDPQTGRKLANVRAHDHAIRALAITADGAKIVAASDDARARVWDARRIMQDRPLDETLTRLAQLPKAYDVWRLGLCWSQGILNPPTPEIRAKNLNEAKERARKLGIELPDVPDFSDMLEQAQFFQQTESGIMAGVQKQFDETHVKLLQAGLLLPFLRGIVDLHNEKLAPLRDEMLPKLRGEFAEAFGAPPTMFDELERCLVERPKRPTVELMFDNLIREFDLQLEGQQRRLAAGASNK